MVRLSLAAISWLRYQTSTKRTADILEENGRTCTVEEDLCLRVVVVDIMVVVSMKVVDISGGTAVVLAEPATLGTSPTNLTLPFILMLGLPSAAMLNTLRPL